MVETIIVKKKQDYETDKSDGKYRKETFSVVWDFPVICNIGARAFTRGKCDLDSLTITTQLTEKRRIEIIRCTECNRIAGHIDNGEIRLYAQNNKFSSKIVCKSCQAKSAQLGRTLSKHMIYAQCYIDDGLGKMILLK